MQQFWLSNVYILNDDKKNKEHLMRSFVIV